MWKIGIGAWLGGFFSIVAMAGSQIGDLINGANAAAEAAKDGSAAWAVWLLTFVLSGTALAMFYLGKRALIAAEVHSSRLISSQYLAFEMLATNREMMRRVIARRDDYAEDHEALEDIRLRIRDELGILSRISDQLPRPANGTRGGSG